MVWLIMLKVSFLCLCVPTLVQSHRIRRRNPVIAIDHDGGADDAMAIFIATLYQKNFGGPKLVALTTVNGNVNETQAYINTQRILNVAERLDVPIYRGSKDALVVPHPTDEYFGKDGLGDNENISYKTVREEDLTAALALIALSKKYAGDLILVTLGPLTNIALAIKLDPDFVKRTRHIYVGAGNLYDKDFPKSTNPEFNVQLDVEAYRVLADNAIVEKVTVLAFSQVRKSLQITTEWRINELGAINTKIIKALNDYERVNLPKSDLWRMLDPAVMAIVLDESIIDDIRVTKNNVILCGEGGGDRQRGTTTNDFDTSDGNMNFVYSASQEQYMKFLMLVFTPKSKRRN